jgi:hypothetical protein
MAITLPIAKSLPAYSGRVELADLMAWLEKEKAYADAFRKDKMADNAGRVYWAGYGDALTNVMHYLTGPGE